MMALLWTFVGMKAGAIEAPGAGSAIASATKRPVVPFELIFQELRSRGAWTQNEGGTWVWQPRGVKADWSPFARGTWVVTGEGWFWLSEDPWGWATSHYGRWDWREKAGWFWLPDRDWSAAWATWRQGEEGIGWRPAASGNEGAGAQMEGWTFLPWSNISRALIPRSTTGGGSRVMNTLEAIVASSATAVAATTDLLAKTRAATGSGPDRSLIESKTGRRLVPCKIVDSAEPRELLLVGRDETVVSAFRPTIKESAAEIQQVIAQKAQRYKAVPERKGAKK